MTNIFKDIKKNILIGESENTKEIVRVALSQNIPANEIFNVMSESIKDIGDKFAKGDLFIIELIASAEAMKAGVEILRPEIIKQKVEVKYLGKVMIGTNQGDIHDIGKNLVCLMLEVAGFKVIDLGVDVSVKKFIEKTREYSPDIIGMSALLTSTLGGQVQVIEELKKENLRNKIKVLVGGAPVTEEWARKIGADGYGSDAGHAVVLTKELLGIS